MTFHLVPNFRDNLIFVQLLHIIKQNLNIFCGTGYHASITVVFQKLKKPCQYQNDTRWHDWVIRTVCMYGTCLLFIKYNMTCWIDILLKLIFITKLQDFPIRMHCHLNFVFIIIRTCSNAPMFVFIKLVWVLSAHCRGYWNDVYKAQFQIKIVRIYMALYTVLYQDSCPK